MSKGKNCFARLVLYLLGSDDWLGCCCLSQGDEFVAGLSEGSLLQSDQFTCLRLSACGISDEGACKLAKALERVGES
jgi:hypothetical protein